MTIGELKKAITESGLPDTAELVGEFSNNQDNVWLIERADYVTGDGLYTPDKDYDTNSLLECPVLLIKLG